MNPIHTYISLSCLLTTLMQRNVLKTDSCVLELCDWLSVRVVIGSENVMLQLTNVFIFVILDRN